MLAEKYRAVGEATVAAWAGAVECEEATEEQMPGCAGCEAATMGGRPCWERAVEGSWAEGRYHSGRGPRDWRREAVAVAKQLRVMLVSGLRLK